MKKIIAFILVLLIMVSVGTAEETDSFSFLDNLSQEELEELKTFLSLDKISSLVAEVERRIAGSPSSSGKKPDSGLVRVDITPENFRDYFYLNAEIQNVSDTSWRYGNANFNTVSGDVILTGYPLAACNIYDLRINVEVLFDPDWAPSYTGSNSMSFSVQIPSDGRFSLTKSFSTTANRWSIHLNNKSAWFEYDFRCYHNGEFYRGAVTDASGYIMVDAAYAEEKATPIPTPVPTPCPADKWEKYVIEDPGITVTGADLSKQYPVPDGALIIETSDTAIKKGLQVGDIITIANGRELVQNASSLHSYLAESGIGRIEQAIVYRPNTFQPEPLQFSDDGEYVSLDLTRDAKTLIIGGYKAAKGYFYSDRASVMNEDNKWGFIDSSGKLVIDCQYAEQTTFSSGYSTVLKNDDKAIKYGVIDPDGNEIIPFGKYEYIGSFSEGRCVIKENGKYGFADHTGSVVIQPVYEKATNFSAGYAAVKVNEQWGAIDKDGNMVITPQFNNYFWFTEDGIAAFDNKQEGVIFIDTAGKRLFPDKKFKSIQGFGCGLSAVAENLDTDQNGNIHYSVINKHGETVFTFDCETIGVFQENMAIFKRNNLFGFVDSNGKEIVPPTYQSYAARGYGFHNGYIAVQKDDKWGVIDKDNRIIIPFEYDHAYTFNEGHSIANKNTIIYIFSEETPEQ